MNGTNYYECICMENSAHRMIEIDAVIFCRTIIPDRLIIADCRMTFFFRAPILSEQGCSLYKF